MATPAGLNPTSNALASTQRHLLPDYQRVLEEIYALAKKRVVEWCNQKDFERLSAFFSKDLRTFFSYQKIKENSDEMEIFLGEEWRKSFSYDFLQRYPLDELEDSLRQELIEERSRYLNCPKEALRESNFPNPLELASPHFPEFSSGCTKIAINNKDLELCKILIKHRQFNEHEFRESLNFSCSFALSLFENVEGLPYSLADFFIDRVHRGSLVEVLQENRFLCHEFLQAIAPGFWDRKAGHQMEVQARATSSLQHSQWDSHDRVLFEQDLRTAREIRRLSQFLVKTSPEAYVEKACEHIKTCEDGDKNPLFILQQLLVDGDTSSEEVKTRLIGKLKQKMLEAPFKASIWVSVFKEGVQSAFALEVLIQLALSLNNDELKGLAAIEIGNYILPHVDRHHVEWVEGWPLWKAVSRPPNSLALPFNFSLGQDEANGLVQLLIEKARSQGLSSESRLSLYIAAMVCSEGLNIQDKTIYTEFLSLYPTLSEGAKQLLLLVVEKEPSLKKILVIAFQQYFELLQGNLKVASENRNLMSFLIQAFPREFVRSCFAFLKGDQDGISISDQGLILQSLLAIVETSSGEVKKLFLDQIGKEMEGVQIGSPLEKAWFFVFENYLLTRTPFAFDLIRLLVDKMGSPYLRLSLTKWEQDRIGNQWLGEDFGVQQESFEERFFSLAEEFQARFKNENLEVEARVRAAAALIESEEHLEAHDPKVHFEVLQKALEIKPDDPKTLSLMGRAYYNGAGIGKNVVQAERYLKKATLNDPRCEHPLVHVNYASFLKFQSDAEQGGGSGPWIEGASKALECVRSWAPAAMNFASELDVFKAKGRGDKAHKAKVQEHMWLCLKLAAMGEPGAVRTVGTYLAKQALEFFDKAKNISEKPKEAQGVAELFEEIMCRCAMNKGKALMEKALAYLIVLLRQKDHHAAYAIGRREILNHHFGAAGEVLLLASHTNPEAAAFLAHYLKGEIGGPVVDVRFLSAFVAASLKMWEAKRLQWEASSLLKKSSEPLPDSLSIKEIIALAEGRDERALLLLEERLRFGIGSNTNEQAETWNLEYVQVWRDRLIDFAKEKGEPAGIELHGDRTSKEKEEEKAAAYFEARRMFTYRQDFNSVHRVADKIELHKLWDYAPKGEEKCISTNYETLGDLKDALKQGGKALELSSLTEVLKFAQIGDEASYQIVLALLQGDISSLNILKELVKGFPEVIWVAFARISLGILGETPARLQSKDVDDFKENDDGKSASSEPSSAGMLPLGTLLTKDDIVALQNPEKFQPFFELKLEALIVLSLEKMEEAAGLETDLEKKRDRYADLSGMHRKRGNLAKVKEMREKMAACMS